MPNRSSSLGMNLWSPPQHTFITTRPLHPFLTPNPTSLTSNMPPPRPLRQILSPRQAIRILLNIIPPLPLRLQHQIKPLRPLTIPRPNRHSHPIRISPMNKINPLRTHLPAQLPILRPGPHKQRIPKHKRHLAEMLDALVRRRQTARQVRVRRVGVVDERPRVEAVDVGG